MTLVDAFCALVGYAEGTDPHSLGIGYDVIVGGHDGPTPPIADFTDHPFASGRTAIYVGMFLGKPVFSTASGRYQIILRTWRSLQARLNLPDFSPPSQDQAAYDLLNERGIPDMLAAGSIAGAINAAGAVWASFPTSAAGQGGKSMQTLLTKWQELTA